MSIVRETYDQGQYDWCEFRPDDRWLDVGAHIGVFCVLAAPHVAYIDAYEPEPGNYAALLHNLELNGIENVTPHNLALVGNDDKERLFWVDWGRNQARHSFIRARESMGATTVKCAPFTEALRGMDGLKLDVEGAEWELLHALEDWGKVRQAVVEFHPEVLPDKEFDVFLSLFDMFDDITIGNEGAEGCRTIYARREL